MSLGQEDPLEKGMATHSSITAWRIPWTEEPGGLTVLGVRKSQTRLKQLSTQTGTILAAPPPARRPRSVFIFHTEWSFADSTAWLELPGRVILFVGNCCSLLTNICWVLPICQAPSLFFYKAILWSWCFHYLPFKDEETDLTGQKKPLDGVLHLGQVTKP